VPGIGVIVNPHARGNVNGGDERAQQLADVLGSDGVVRVTESLPAIQEVAREFRGRDTEILAICGGDGSYHCTLTGFRGVYGDAPLPLLLPLRAGTINYVAKATGGRRGRPEQVLARVVRDYRHGRTYETTERDLLRVNGTEYGFVLSFGTAVNYLRAYYAMEKQGPLQAARLLTRLIVSALAGTHISRAVFQAIAADVECDGLPVPFRQFTFFFAATVDRIALGFRPTYLATRKPGYFHVVGGPIPASRLIRRALRVYRGFPTGEPTLYDNLGRRLTIRFFRPEHYMLDGDILAPADRLEVDVPCRVTFIRG
jgi:diacylglycerol kinase family enzyme